MDLETLIKLGPALIQGGFVVVSLVLSWVVYHLWLENRQLQKDKDTEKAALYEKIIAANKADMEEQVVLIKEIMTELTKTRTAISSLSKTKGASSSPQGGES